MTDFQKDQLHEIEWTQSKSIRIWNYYASSHAHQDKYFGRKFGKQVAKLLSQKLFRKVSTILDYSCGQGDLLSNCLPHLNRKHEVYACDVSQNSVDITNEKLESSQTFKEAFLVEKIPSPLPSDTYDLTIATEVLEHLSDFELKDILGDIHRISKKGGYVFVTVPFEENLDIEKTACPECGCIFHRWQHQRSWTVESLAKSFREHGFDVVECKGILWGPWPLRIYFSLAKLSVNGIYLIGRKK